MRDCQSSDCQSSAPARRCDAGQLPGLLQPGLTSQASPPRPSPAGPCSRCQPAKPWASGARGSGHAPSRSPPRPTGPTGVSTSRTQDGRSGHNGPDGLNLSLSNETARSAYYYSAYYYWGVVRTPRPCPRKSPSASSSRPGVHRSMKSGYIGGGHRGVHRWTRPPRGPGSAPPERAPLRGGECDCRGEGAEEKSRPRCDPGRIHGAESDRRTPCPLSTVSTGASRIRDRDRYRVSGSLRDRKDRASLPPLAGAPGGEGRPIREARVASAVRR